MTADVLLTALVVVLIPGTGIVHGVLAGAVRDRVVGSPTLVHRLQQGFAGMFAVLGLRLAVQERERPQAEERVQTGSS